MTPSNSATNHPISDYVFQDIDFQDTYKLSTKILTEDKDHKPSICIFSDRDQPHILSVPRQLPCGHRACRACLEVQRLLSNGEFCCPNNDVNPNQGCAEKITPERCYNDKCAEREMNQFPVRCKHYKVDQPTNSCNWIGRLVDYRNAHLPQCPIGKTDYLTKENQYLKKQVQILRALPSNEQEDDQSPEINQLRESIDELKTTITSKEHQISKLETTLKHSEEKHSEQISAFEAELSDCQSEIAAFKLHFQDLSGGSDNTQTKPAAAAAKPGPSRVTTGQTPQKKRSVSPAGISRSRNWTFNYVTAIKNADDRVVSEPFTLGHYDYRLLFKYNRFSEASLYLQVMGGDKDAVWPCEESLSLALKAQSPDGASPKHDISQTLHLANAPVMSRSRPGKSPDTANAAVGFAKFCSERYLTLSRGGARQDVLYLDENSQITLSVSPAKERSRDCYGHVYEVIPGSIGLYWPVTEYSRKDGQYSSPSDGVAISPKFYTSAGGYCFRLKLDTQSSMNAGSTYTGVSAFHVESNNDDKVKWPMAGNLSVTLVDRNPRSAGKDITVNLPIAFDKPSTTSHHMGQGSQTSKEINFYPRMSVWKDGGGSDLSKPVYRYNDTVLVTAYFVPK